jgi:acetylornithine deacetylase
VDDQARSALLALIDPEEVVSTTRELLRIPSFSGSEAALAARLAEELEEIGLDVEMAEVEPGRSNVIGRLRGAEAGPRFLFNGHMDHNPVATGWTHDPFGADLEDGWIIALGSVNMKSALGAYLAAARAIVASGRPIHGELIVEYVVGELQGGIGTRHDLEYGLQADLFIDGEPTELQVKTRHAGITELRFTVFGRMRHFHYRSTDPTRHAIEAAIRLIQRLGPSYTPIVPGGWLEFATRPGWDGLPQLNLGSIVGGIGPEYASWRPALCPDRCSFLVDVRTIPGQTPEHVLADARRLVAGMSAVDPTFQAEVDLAEGHIPMIPFEVPDDAPLVQRVAEAHTAIRGEAPVVGDTGPSRFAGADSGHLLAAGITGLLYGPGGRYLSMPDERVLAADVVDVARVYALAAGSTLLA